MANIGKQARWERPSASGERILAIAQDANLREEWVSVLDIAGCLVEVAGSAAEALVMLANTAFDLVLINLPLPDMDDPDFLQCVRRLQSETLIIVRSCKPSIESAIVAVKIGAVDYLTKPSTTEEVVQAVVGARERRTAQEKRLQGLLDEAVAGYFGRLGISTELGGQIDPELSSVVVAGSFQLSRSSRALTFVGADEPVIKLTKGETEVMAVLLSRAGQVVSSRKLVQLAWRYDSQDESAGSIIRPYISRLRKKLKDHAIDPQVIQTVRGLGYMFDIRSSSD